MILHKIIQAQIFLLLAHSGYSQNLGIFNMFSQLQSPFSSTADGFTLQLSKVAWRVVDSDTLSVEIPATMPINSLMSTTRCDVYYEGNMVPTTTTAIGNTVNIRVVDAAYDRKIQSGMSEDLQIICRNAFNQPINASDMSNMKIKQQESNGTTSSSTYVRSTINPLFSGATRSVSHSVGTAGSTGDQRWRINGVSGAVPNGSTLEQIIPSSWTVPTQIVCTINSIVVNPMITIISGGAKLISTVIPPQFTDSVVATYTGALDLVCKDVKVPAVLDSVFGGLADILKQVFRFPNGQVVSDIPSTVTDITGVVTLGADNNKSIVTSSTSTNTNATLSISLLSSAPITIIPGLTFKIDLPQEGLLEVSANAQCVLYVTPTAISDATVVAAQLSLALLPPTSLQAIVTTLTNNKDKLLGILKLIECSPVLTSRYMHPLIGEVSVSVSYGGNMIGVGTGYTLSPIAHLTGLTGQIDLQTSTDKQGDLVSLLINIPTNGIEAGDVLEQLQPTQSWGLFNRIGYFFGQSQCGVITEYDQNTVDLGNLSINDFIPGIDVEADGNAQIQRFPSDIATVGLGIYCDFAANPIADFFSTAIQIPGALYNVWDKYVRPVVDTVMTIAFDALQGLFGKIANIRTVVQNSQTGSVAQLDISLLEMSTVQPNSASSASYVPPVYGSTSYMLISVPPGYSFGRDTVCSVSSNGQTISETTSVIPFSTLQSQTARTKTLSDMYSGNLNTMGSSGLGRTAQVRINAPNVPLTESRVECSNFLLPTFATDPSKQMEIRVYSKRENNTGWNQVGYSGEGGLPATDPAGMSDATLSINSRTPGQITSATLGIRALSNDIAVGSSLHVMLPPSVVSSDEEPRCILQSGGNIIKGTTSMYQSSADARNSVRGLKAYSVYTEGANYRVQTSSHSRVVTTATFEQDSQLIASRSDSPTTTTTSTGEQALTIKFSPNSLIPAKTTITLLCGNLRLNPTTSPSKFVDGTTLVWSQRPDAAIDVAVARVSYISNYQDSSTHAVVGNAALLHTIVISGAAPVPVNLIYLLEATYAEFLGHIGVSVTLMRQYVTYQFAIDSKMLSLDTNVPSMQAFKSVTPMTLENLNPDESAFVESSTEDIEDRTPQIKENKSKAADRDKVLLLTTRIIASNPAEEISVLTSNVHQASTLLSIGNSFSGITGRALVKMYTAQPFPWATYIDQCMDPSVCGGSSLICQQCYAGQKCAAAIDCYSNACNYGVCNGAFEEPVNSSSSVTTTTLSIFAATAAILLSNYLLNRQVQRVQ